MPCTFNLYGLFDGIDFINTLIDYSDILCLRELWLRPQSLIVYDNFNSEFNLFLYQH